MRQFYSFNMNKGFLQNVVAIAVVLGIVFLSQQPQTRPMGRAAWSQALTYWQKGRGWFEAKLLPQAAPELAKRGVPLKNAITQQKNTFAQNIWDNMKNYFSEKLSQISGTQIQ